MHVCREGLLCRSPKNRKPPNQSRCFAEAAKEVPPCEAREVDGNPSQLPTASLGTLEMGLSYLDRLDGMCPSDANAAPVKDPTLELEGFLASNLSGEFYYSRR